MSVVEQLTKDLKSLGSTPGEVASSLSALGIKGGVTCLDCPIAKYLIGKGYSSPYVKRTGTMLDDGTWVDNPPAVIDFISAYDEP